MAILGHAVRLRGRQACCHQPAIASRRDLPNAGDCPGFCAVDHSCLLPAATSPVLDATAIAAKTQLARDDRALCSQRTVETVSWLPPM